MKYIKKIINMWIMTLAWATHNSQNSGELVPLFRVGRMEEKSSRYYCWDTGDDDTHSAQTEAPAGCYGTSVISSILQKYEVNVDMYYFRKTHYVTRSAVKYI